MSDGPLLNDVTRAFAETHRNEDVRDLALKTKRTADLDLPAALDQIAGWQIARNRGTIAPDKGTREWGVVLWRSPDCWPHGPAATSSPAMST